MPIYETPPSAQALKTPDIEVALQELDKELSVLVENIGGLEARLQKLMTPDNPKPEGINPVPQPPHSQHYVALEDLRRRLVNTNGKIANIKERLEV